MSLSWQPTPYRRRKDDQFADVPNRLGRYRVKWDKLTKRYHVFYNGSLVSSETTLDAAEKRAEVGARLLIERHA